MGNPFSKDGAITKLVEPIPGGGLIAYPVHAAAAGNPIHAGQAAIACFGTTAAAVLGGPVGAIVARAGTAGLSGIFDQLNLNDDKKNDAVQAISTGNAQLAGTMLLEAGNMKIVENSRQLSAESGGRRILKSCHGTFLRAYDDEKKVDMAPEAKGWEQWYIEEWRGRVFFKAIHSPGRFLRAHPDGHVDLTLAHPQEWEIWTPFKNHDGSWSFLSHHGKWLSADKNGSVYCVERCNSCEHFWLSRW